jgi:hypothetical protein
MSWLPEQGPPARKRFKVASVNQGAEAAPAYSGCMGNRFVKQETE